MRVVSITAERRKRARKAAHTRKRNAASLDPREKVAGRLFEFTTDAQTFDGVSIRVRIRLAKPGGVAKNLTRLTPRTAQIVVGLMQVELTLNRWSEPSYGGIPLSAITSFREIVERPVPTAVSKD